MSPNDPLKPLEKAISEAIEANRNDPTKWDPLYEWFSSQLGAAEKDIAGKLLTANKQLSNRITKELAQKNPCYAVLAMIGDDYNEGDVLRHLEAADLRRIRSVLITKGTLPHRLIVFEEDAVTTKLESVIGTGVPREDREKSSPDSEPPSDQEVNVDLAVIATHFANSLERNGIYFDELTQLDLLASCLSSQMLLFAGPSGTGKSTAALALARFFAPTKHAVVLGETAWTNPEDFVGYFSVFQERFVASSRLNSLRSLEGGDAPPFLVIEEANLSPIEGYLSPVVHQLSGIGKEEIVWKLYDSDDDSEASIVLRPFPRVLGSINVDSSALGPAKKISARACVILLEPPEAINLQFLASSIGRENPAPEESPAWVVGDPKQLFLKYISDDDDGHKLAELVAPLDKLVKFIAKELGMNLLSPRDAQRCMCYMAAFVRLSGYQAEWDYGEPTQHAAEHALLHFVLPGLPGQQFSRIVSSLVDSELLNPGGLLRRRLERLHRVSGEHGFGVVTDFWAALS
jgi:DNA polymerase III delta prime subunit